MVLLDSFLSVVVLERNLRCESPIKEISREVLATFTKLVEFLDLLSRHLCSLQPEFTQDFKKMNSKLVFVMTVVVLMSTLLMHSQAFSAGAGGLPGKKREYNSCAQVGRLLITFTDGLFSCYISYKNTAIRVPTDGS